MDPPERIPSPKALDVPLVARIAAHKKPGIFRRKEQFATTFKRLLINTVSIN